MYTHIFIQNLKTLRKRMNRIMKNMPLFFFLLFSTLVQSQEELLIENKAIRFQIQTKQDRIQFIVVDTLLEEKKPIFLWCQGSLPIPLFCEIDGHGTFFFGGGISNFDYKKIVAEYHLVIISMPYTPLLGRKENLNKHYQYVPNKQYPKTFSSSYIAADYLDNYVYRAKKVLKYLRHKKWVDNNKLVVAGHSQGSKIATKIARTNSKVTHLGLFAANPFGRIDQYVRQARLDAKQGEITWEKADSLMNNYYDFYAKSHQEDSIKKNPSLRAWSSFSELFYDDWLKLNIPIYLAYGTGDRTADLCDLIPLFFIQENKNNLTLKRYLHLEHNFFELDKQSKIDYDKAHWPKVMNDFLQWIQ